MKFEIHHKKRRYWASIQRFVDGRVRWKFWSDHKWPFYHGHFTQRTEDRMEAYQAFLDWLPFDTREHNHG